MVAGKIPGKAKRKSLRNQGTKKAQAGFATGLGHLDISSPEDAKRTVNVGCQRSAGPLGRRSGARGRCPSGRSGGGGAVAGAGGCGFLFGQGVDAGVGGEGGIGVIAKVDGDLGFVQSLILEEMAYGQGAVDRPVDPRACSGKRPGGNRHRQRGSSGPISAGPAN